MPINLYWFPIVRVKRILQMARILCFTHWLINLLNLLNLLGSTETHVESQSLLKKEKVDEESNRGKLSAKLCNGMFSWSLDLEQDNI